MGESDVPGILGVLCKVVRRSLFDHEVEVRIAGKDGYHVRRAGVHKLNDGRIYVETPRFSFRPVDGRRLVEIYAFGSPERIEVPESEIVFAC